LDNDRQARLRFIAGTGLIATFAILVGGSKGDDDDR
jgi:hypothetical protein